MLPRCVFALLLGSLAALADVATTRLEPETVRAFNDYVKKRELQIARRYDATGTLWCLERSSCRHAVRDAAYVEGHNGSGISEIKGGLVHDWTGATFIPGASLDQVLGVLRNYPNHKQLFQPEVVDSRVIQQRGDDYKVFLRLRKKKILTVILNTEYDVIFRKLDAKRAYSESRSTKIAEFDEGREYPVGDDHGFLWRLNAYWRLHEMNGGVYVECETISLSRGVPFFLTGIMSPILKQLPRESLEKTLLATRNALANSQR